MNIECHGCGVSCEDTNPGLMRIGLQIHQNHSVESSSDPYCPKCSLKIEEFDRHDLHDKVNQVVKAVIADPRKTTVTISESLVREIANNLGASYRLSDALVERIFGRNWTGAPPEDSGIVMNKYKNRDRLTAFVAEKLKDLWTLEAQ